MPSRLVTCVRIIRLLYREMGHAIARFSSEFRRSDGESRLISVELPYSLHLEQVITFTVTFWLLMVVGWAGESGNT